MVDELFSAVIDVSTSGALDGLGGWADPARTRDEI
jgi:hypothetical protein